MKLTFLFLLTVLGSVDPGSGYQCPELEVKEIVVHTLGDESNGSIELQVENGSTPYSYFFLDEKYNPLKHDHRKSKISDLSKGKIKYIVRDKNNCSVSGDIIIE